MACKSKRGSCRYARNNEVVFPARYQVNAEELGFLLQHLGRRLGAQLPRGVPPPEAHGQIFDEPLEVDSRGWFRCRISRLQFPPICCVCEEKTTETRSFVAESRAEFLLNLGAQRGRSVTVAIPLCDRCQAEAQRAQLSRASMFVAIGAVLTPIVFYLAMRQNGGLAAEPLAFLAMVTAFLGGLAGLLIGFWSERGRRVRCA